MTVENLMLAMIPIAVCFAYVRSLMIKNADYQMKFEALEIIDEYQTQPSHKRESFRKEYDDLVNHWWSRKRELEGELDRRFQRRNRTLVQFVKDWVFFSMAGRLWNHFDSDAPSERFALTERHAVSMILKRYIFIRDGLLKYDMNLQIKDCLEDRVS